MFNKGEDLYKRQCCVLAQGLEMQQLGMRCRLENAFPSLVDVLIKGRQK